MGSPEGTTGIQALDLVGRKILLDRAQLFKAFSLEILAFCKDHSMISSNPQKNRMHKFIWQLSKETANWQRYTISLMLKARKNRDFVGACSVDYLMYSGYVFMAYMWAKMAQTANEKLTEGTGDKEFYKAKIRTAEFYYERMLPRTKSLAKTMMSDADSLMKISVDQF